MAKCEEINKYSNKDSFEIKVSKYQDEENVNFTGFWKDISDLKKLWIEDMCFHPDTTFKSNDRGK